MAATGSSGPSGRRTAGDSPTWSGTSPVALRRRGPDVPSPDVWTVGADGSGQRKVLDNAFQPRWSPDGSKLLFQRYEANPDLATLGVYLARSDGTGVRELVRAALWGSPGVPPAWSPTGRTILYGETVVGAVHVTRLSTVTADGRYRRTLTSGVARRLGVRTAAGSPSRAQAASGSSPRAAAGHAESQPRRCGRPSVSGLVAHRKAARIQLRQPAVRRPHRRALDETRHAGRHRTLAGCCRVSPPVWSRNGRRLYYWS